MSVVVVSDIVSAHSRFVTVEADGLFAARAESWFVVKGVKLKVVLLLSSFGSLFAVD